MNLFIFTLIIFPYNLPESWALHNSDVISSIPVSFICYLLFKIVYVLHVQVQFLYIV